MSLLWEYFVGLVFMLRCDIHHPAFPVSWFTFFFCEHSQILTSSLFTLFCCFQDILRLLTLWFNHGATAEVQMALHKGFSYVNIDTWLVVLPQIIARIHSNNHAVRELIQSLLVRIGESHPQVCLRLFLCFFIIF